MNAFKNAGQFGLDELVAGIVKRAVLLEDAFGFGKLRHVLGAFEAVGETVGNREAFAGELDGGRDDVGPFGLAVFALRIFETAGGAGDAGGAPAGERVAGGVAVLVEIHVAGSGEGGAFAEVDEGGAAVGETDEHEAAAAEIAGAGVGDGEGKAHRCGRIDGVAAGLQNGHAGVGGVRFAGDHHGLAGADRLGCLQPRQHQSE